MYGRSVKQAKLAYGIDGNANNVKRVEQAMSVVAEIQKSVIELAKLEDTALLNSLPIPKDIASESELDESESESDYLDSDDGSSENENISEILNEKDSETPE